MFSLMFLIFCLSSLYLANEKNKENKKKGGDKNVHTVYHKI